MAANTLAASESSKISLKIRQINNERVNEQLGLNFELVILWNYVRNIFGSIFVID